MSPRQTGKRKTGDPRADRQLVALPPPEERTFEDIADWAMSLPERFLYCREMGHNWRPLSAGRFQDGGFERILRCVRCRTTREQTISERGLVLSNKYGYAEGYQHKGLGRLAGESRGALRLASIQRLVDKEL